MLLGHQKYPKYVDSVFHPFLCLECTMHYHLLSAMGKAYASLGRYAIPLFDIDNIRGFIIQ